MATNTISVGGASLGESLDFLGHTVISQDNDDQLLQLANGLKLKLIGTGLDYDAQGRGIGGTLTSLELYQNDGTTLLLTLTDINRPFQNFYDAAETFDTWTLSQWLLNGDDTMVGSQDGDILEGHAGNDTLNGNGDDDYLDGGSGDDTYSGGDGFDELSFESAYFDPSAFQGVNITVTAPGNGTATDSWGNSETFTTIEAFRGTQFADVMVGFTGNEQFRGMGGRDNIDGGAGIDEVRYDRDQIRGGTFGVSVNLTTGVAFDGFGQQDTLANIENIRGTAFNDVITGNAVSNELRGLGGNDTLNGGGGADLVVGGLGDDMLDGGAGPDQMLGGAGNDTYVVDDAGDSVDEFNDSGSGIDTVRSLITFNLAGGQVQGQFENLTLLGGANINGVGNALNNVLIGNIGANVLNAGAGNDTLNGGVGADHMLGGIGNDTYVVDNPNDIVNESGGNGIDTVISSINFNLGNTARVAGAVENLTLLNVASALNATGNALANVITGNNFNNTLDGAAGNDTLRGMNGNDILIGNLGKDTMSGGANNDIFRFAATSHSLVGVNADVITDFDDFGDDRIDVSALFGPAMTYRHNLAFTAAGQVRINDIAGADLLVEVNTGGSLAADFAIRLTATALASMAAGDFIL